MKKIAYMNSGFFDTDITVVKGLQSKFQVEWFVVLGPAEPYDSLFFHNFVCGTNIHLHLYQANCRIRSFSYMKIMYKVVKDIKMSEPSVIYTCCTHIYFTMFYKYILRKFPLVIGIHDVKLHSDSEKSRLLNISRFFAIHSTNNFLQFSNSQHLLFNSLYPSKKSSFVGMSVKNFGFSTIKKPINFDNKIKILFFGTLQAYKGYDILIDAFERLINCGITNVELSIYGKCANPIVESVCREKIKHPDFYNLNLNFIQNKDVPNIFTSHHFCVFPYRDATQSGPLMIAANYGLPIISPTFGCFMDVYTNKVNSLMYDSNSKDGLFDVLKCVSNLNFIEYNKYRNSASLLIKTYSEEVIVEKYIKVFEKF